MRISKHIHALRIPFKIQIAPEITLDRLGPLFIIMLFPFFLTKCFS